MLVAPLRARELKLRLRFHGSLRPHVAPLRARELKSDGDYNASTGSDVAPLRARELKSLTLCDISFRSKSRPYGRVS